MPHRPRPWAPPHPDAHSVAPGVTGLLCPSTVEDLQSLICKQLGSTNCQTEDGGSSMGLRRRAGTSGGYDSASGPSKSEWCPPTVGWGF